MISHKDRRDTDNYLIHIGPINVTYRWMIYRMTSASTSTTNETLVVSLKPDRYNAIHAVNKTRLEVNVVETHPPHMGHGSFDCIVSNTLMMLQPRYMKPYD